MNDEWRFSIMQGVPTIIMPPMEFDRFKDEFYPDAPIFTDGKIRGFFNAIQYFIAKYD